MTARRFKFTQFLLPSNDVHESAEVGWKRSQRQVARYTSRCPWITQKFSVPLARTVTDSIQSALTAFNVVSLSDYDHTRDFPDRPINTNSHMRNIAFLTQNSMFHELILGSSLHTSNHLKR